MQKYDHMRAVSTYQKFLLYGVRTLKNACSQRVNLIF